MPTRPVPSAALAVILVTVVGHVALAEVPPLPPDKLADKSKLVVTGKVTSIEEKVLREDKSGFKETEVRVRVQVTGVSKGELKDRDRPIVAIGKAYELAPGKAGSGGHYSANSDHRLRAVQKDWELKLYLTPGKDGAYEILFPNGFEVTKQPGGK
jgi:hypothetical protein